MQIEKFLTGLTDKISKIKSFLVVISFSPWLVILYVLISTYSKKLGSDDLYIIQNFIQWFGTAYSLFLTLVLVNVWNQFDITCRNFDREVDALATLYQTVSYTKAINPVRENDLLNFKSLIITDIQEYLRHVIINYKDEHLIVQQRLKGDKILEEIGKKIGSMANGKIIIDPITAELFKNLNEARDGRGDRIEQSKKRIPQAVWLVAVTASLFWLLPFFALNIVDPFVKVFLIGGIAFVIVVFLAIIYDFDSPIDGTWKVSIDSWREFLETFDPNPHFIFVFKYNNWLNDLLSRTMIGKRFGLPLCKLSTLSRERFLGWPWAQFVRGTRRRHSNKIKESRSDVFYVDDFNRQGYIMDLSPGDLPVVLLKIGDELNELIETQEIIRCSNLGEFTLLFYNKLKSRIPDFEQWTKNSENQHTNQDVRITDTDITSA